MNFLSADPSVEEGENVNKAFLMRIVFKIGSFNKPSPETVLGVEGLRRALDAAHKEDG